MGRSSWVSDEAMGHVLAALTPQNRLVMEVCISTGLRVGDVLALKTAALRPRQTIREQKTGKTRRVRWRKDLYERMLAGAGRLWVFEGRTDWKRHRTRQAVWKDLRRISRVFLPGGGIPRGAQVSPHSARKMYAVGLLHQTGDLRRVQKELNHDSEAVTLLYAMADQIARKGGGKCGQIG